AVVYMEKQAVTNSDLIKLRGEAAALLGLSEKAADLAPQALTDELQLLTLLLDVDAKSAWAYRRRGQFHLGRRSFERALSDFAKVTDLRPFDPEAWHDRGLAHYLLKQYAEAGTNYRKAIEINPNHAATLSSMNDLGVAYWQARQLDRSIPLFEETVRLK